MINKNGQATVNSLRGSKPPPWVTINVQSYQMPDVVMRDTDRRKGAEKIQTTNSDYPQKQTV